jgi:chromosome segregation ATPase
LALKKLQSKERLQRQHYGGESNATGSTESATLDNAVDISYISATHSSVNQKSTHFGYESPTEESKGHSGNSTPVRSSGPTSVLFPEFGESDYHVSEKASAVTSVDMLSELCALERERDDTTRVLTAEIQQLKSSILQREETLNQLTKTYLHGNEQYIAQIQQMQSQLKEYEIRYESLQETYEKEKMLWETRKKKVSSDSAMKVAEIEHQYEASLETIKGEQLRFDSLQSTVNAYNRALRKIGTALHVSDGPVVLIDSEISHNDSAVDTLDAWLNAILASMTRLVEECDQPAVEAAHLRAELLCVQKMCADKALKDEAFFTAKLGEMQAAHNLEMAEHEARCQDLEIRVNDAHESIAAKEARIQEVTSEIDAIRASLAEEVLRRARAAKQHTFSETKCRDLQAQCKQLQTQHDELKTDCDRLKFECESLRASSEVNQEENQRLKTVLAARSKSTGTTGSHDNDGNDSDEYSSVDENQQVRAREASDRAWKQKLLRVTNQLKQARLQLALKSEEDNSREISQLNANDNSFASNVSVGSMVPVTEMLAAKAASDAHISELLQLLRLKQSFIDDCRQAQEIACREAREAREALAIMSAAVQAQAVTPISQAATPSTVRPSQVQSATASSQRRRKKTTPSKQRYHHGQDLEYVSDTTPSINEPQGSNDIFDLLSSSGSKEGDEEAQEAHRFSSDEDVVHDRGHNMSAGKAGHRIRGRSNNAHKHQHLAHAHKLAESAENPNASAVIESLRSKLLSANETEDELREQLRDLRSELSEAEIANDRVDALTEALSVAAATIEKTRSEAQAMRDHLVDVETELSQVTDKLEQSEQRLQEIGSRLKEAELRQLEAEHDLDKIKIEKESLLREVQMGTERLQRANTDNSKLEEEYAVLQADFEHLSQSFDGTTVGLKNHITELEKENISLRDKLNRAQGVVDQLSVDDSHTIFKGIFAQLETANEHVTELTTDLAEKEATIDHLKVEVQRLEGDVDRFHGELEHSFDYNKELETDLLEKTKQIKELTDRKTVSSSEIISLREQLREARDRVSYLTEKVEEHTNTIASMKSAATLASLQTARDSESVVVTLKAELAAAKQFELESHEKTTALADQVSSLQQQLSFANEMVSSLQNVQVNDSKHDKTELPQGASLRSRRIGATHMQGKDVGNLQISIDQAEDENSSGDEFIGDGSDALAEQNVISAAADESGHALASSLHDVSVIESSVNDSLNTSTTTSLSNTPDHANQSIRSNISAVNGNSFLDDNNEFDLLSQLTQGQIGPAVENLPVVSAGTATSPEVSAGMNSPDRVPSTLELFTELNSNEEEAGPGLRQQVEEKELLLVAANDKIAQLERQLADSLSELRRTTDENHQLHQTIDNLTRLLTEEKDKTSKLERDLQTVTDVAVKQMRMATPRKQQQPQSKF